MKEPIKIDELKAIETQNLPILRGKQIRFLRANAHSLKPFINIGKGGMTKSLYEQVDRCLTQHELIKVRVLENCPEDKLTCSRLLAESTHAAVVQIIGKTVILYRPNPEEPILQLP